MIASTDEEIAQVIERLSWSADDLVLILFSTTGLPTIFMDRGFHFYRADNMRLPLQLDMPITEKMIHGWLQQPHERVHGRVVRAFISQDGEPFAPADENKFTQTP
jgi:hypothetical protein